MRRFYKQSLWIPQNFLLTNPDLHHGLLRAYSVLFWDAQQHYDLFSRNEENNYGQCHLDQIDAALKRLEEIAPHVDLPQAEVDNLTSRYPLKGRVA